MTFLELCEQTFELHNRYPVAFSSVDLGKSGGEFILTDPTQRQVIRAVQNAYNYILGLSSHWSFTHLRGRLLGLTAGIEVYSPGMYDAPVWDSLFVLEGSYRRPVQKLEYEDWLGWQQAEMTPEGAVIFMTETPEKNWSFWPVPMVDCELWGDAFLREAGLEDASDEPPWDADLHWVVAELAEMLIEMRLDSVEEAVQQLNVRASAMGNLMGVKLMLKRYTPRFVWA